MRWAHHTMSARYLLQLFVCSAILIVVLRTWFVLGLVAPVTVSGSSMAPTLCGDHFACNCPDCHQLIRIGARFVPAHDLVCPGCGRTDISRESLVAQPATRLVVDRTAFVWRDPRRWEIAVFRAHDSDQLHVKRIIGG